jgi:hypothetical protein
VLTAAARQLLRVPDRAPMALSPPPAGEGASVRAQGLAVGYPIAPTVALPSTTGKDKGSKGGKDAVGGGAAGGAADSGGGGKTGWAAAAAAEHRTVVSGVDFAARQAGTSPGPSKSGRTSRLSDL